MIDSRPIQTEKQFITASRRLEQLETDQGKIDLESWELQELTELEEELERCPFVYDDHGNITRKTTKKS